MRVLKFEARSAPAAGRIELSWRMDKPVANLAEMPRVQLIRSASSYLPRSMAAVAFSDPPLVLEDPAFESLYASEDFVGDALNYGDFLRKSARREQVDGFDVLLDLRQFVDEQGRVVAEEERIIQDQELLPGELPTELTRTLRFVDQVDAQPGATRARYYSLLVVYPDGTNQLHTATAVASDADFGFAQRLYQALPSMYRRYEQREAAGEKGALQRFLELIGDALDLQATGDRGLLDCHDPRRAPGPLLTLLADKIGWWVDPTQPFPVQRSRLADAAELYKSVGTVPGIQALVYQVGGKRARVREFAMNVFHSNAPELPFVDDDEGKLVRSRSKSVDVSGEAQARRHTHWLPGGDQAPFSDYDDPSKVKTFEDTLHYTYDTRRPHAWVSVDDDGKSDGWYAYDRIGVFLQEEADQAAFDRILSAADYYLPLHVRAVLIQAAPALVHHPS